MGFPQRAPIPTPLRTASVLTGVVAVGLALTPPAAAAPAPWAPAPVNSCGEVGFDPLAREPQPDTTPWSPPPTIRIPVPVPEFVPVPIPGPAPDDTRIDPAPLPPDPCASPCPDLRHNPSATGTPATPSGTPPELPDSERPPEPTPTPTAPPEPAPEPQTSQPPVPALPRLPEIEIVPETEPIPIPVPGGEPPEPQPAPTPTHVPPAPGPLAAPVAPPRVTDVRLVEQLTGPGSENRTDIRWQVDGTDLGLMWENRPGEVAVVFGDTFGEGWVPDSVGGPDWRSNVLAYSTDRDLSDGLTLDSFVQDSRCHAAELLGSRKIKNFETTTIPTSGFALGDRQYLTYMSVNRWSRIPGMWWTNHGGLAWSDDNGRTWVKSQHAQWDNLFGIGRFQVATMVPHGDWVYMFGTPNGRMGVIGLARVPAAEVLNKTAYQYWVGGNWVPADGPNELLATPLVLGTASELSIRYDQGSGQWQMVYLDAPAHQLVLRTAAAPQGTWSDPIPLVSTRDYPATYGGFIHPWSTAEDLYFTLSAWGSYNVYLMHAKLEH
ncbi:DUF4185 domain-containing protein [Nocardia otitidiscaviarum]|uniref:DUF4185 domain-containing protein n=1 Tax=Nocardia otitidiscaviarum TaxID=1823 RepID=UPI001894DF46|nr:DUF4185 domain-containing protein [Nocardia otitidiscaviarum]MBF6178720.1 DUF4185 domain-containing protein [Nocardia otitidiscaviarum]